MSVSTAPVPIDYERAYRDLEVTVELLEGRVERRNEALRDLRRKVLIDILQYKLGGDNRIEVQQAVAEDMQCDDITILELREEIDHWESQCKRRDQEIDTLRRKLQAEYQRNKSFVKNQEKFSFAAEEKIRQYEVEKKHKQTLLCSREATIDRQQQNIASLQATISSLENEHARVLSLCETHLNRINEQEVEISVLNNEIATMRGTLSERNKTIKEVSIESNIVTNRNTKLQTQIDELQERNAKLLKQLDDLISHGAKPHTVAPTTSEAPQTPPVVSSRRPSSVQSPMTPPRRASTRVSKPTTITRSRLGSVSTTNAYQSIPEDDDAADPNPSPVAPSIAPMASRRAPRLSVYTLSASVMEELTSPKQRPRRASQRFEEDAATPLLRDKMNTVATQTDDGSTENSMKSLTALFATKDKEISDLKLKISTLVEDIDSINKENDAAYANISTENEELRNQIMELKSTCDTLKSATSLPEGDAIDNAGMEIVHDLVEFRPAETRPRLLSRRVSSLNETAMMQLLRAPTVSTFDEENDEEENKLKPYLGIRRGHDWNIEMFVYKNCKYTQCDVSFADAGCQAEDGLKSESHHHNYRSNAELFSIATQTKHARGGGALESDEHILERLFKDTVDVCKHFQERYIQIVEQPKNSTTCYLDAIMTACDSTVWMDDHLKQSLDEELQHAVTHRRRIESATSLLASLFVLHGDFVDEVSRRHDSSVVSRLLVRCLEAIMYSFRNILDPHPAVPISAFTEMSDDIEDVEMPVCPPLGAEWRSTEDDDLTISPTACHDIIHSYVPTRAIYTENKVLFARPPPLDLRQRSRDMIGGGSPSGVLNRSRDTSPTRRSRKGSPQTDNTPPRQRSAGSPGRGVFTINEHVSYQDIIDMSAVPVSPFLKTEEALPRSEANSGNFGLTSTRLHPRRNINSR